MWRIWHRMLIRFDKDVSANFMNYGYHYMKGDTMIPLKKEDEPNRYCIQLYDHVVSRIPIEDKDVLEVGSGRGGGADYIARYYRPRSYRAVDISSDVVRFCNSYYNVDGLSFKRGHAEDLPIEDDSCDVVVNVESARCYRDIMAFFREVARVLRPGGHFMFADMIPPDHLKEITDGLKTSGFTIRHRTDITSNVVKALEKDSERRERIIRKRSPGFLRKSFAQFAGTRGTERFESFRNGKFQYWSFVLAR
jgi:ubiquinone/menaquinone biosynthesis C-methylase UbiE